MGKGAQGPGGLSERKYIRGPVGEAGEPSWLLAQEEWLRGQSGLQGKESRGPWGHLASA